MCWFLWKRTTPSTVLDTRSTEFSPNISTILPENIHENNKVLHPPDRSLRYRVPENNECEINRDMNANRNGSNAGISVSYSEGLRRSPEEYETIQREEIAKKNIQNQCLNICCYQCCCCCYIDFCCNLCI